MDGLQHSVDKACPPAHLPQDTRLLKLSAPPRHQLTAKILFLPFNLAKPVHSGLHGLSDRLPHAVRPPRCLAPSCPPRPARVPSRPGAAWASAGVGPRPGQASSGLPRPTPSGATADSSPHLEAGGWARAAPGWGGDCGAALTAPLGLGSGGGGSGDGDGGDGGGGGGGGSSSARTTRSGPRPGHAPPARALIGQCPPWRAVHWSACLSLHLGRAVEVGLPVGAACERLGGQPRRGWPAMAAEVASWAQAHGGRLEAAVQERRSLSIVCCVPSICSSHRRCHPARIPGCLVLFPRGDLRFQAGLELTM
ncbi:uncharacterized protein LOC111756568 [Cavia porcellus]|uniref:uncharacterized protein LOC111756568 n=1 Tax=Cavia porcellus TaxID=10141 RepID=UPI002FE238A3